MAEALAQPVTRVGGALGGALEWACRWWAIGGGIVLMAMAAMSLASIAGRTLLSRPLLGDYELVQVMSAVAVSMALPYCQLVKGHVIVDFFTTHWPAGRLALLDALANLLLAASGFIVSVCVAQGMLDLRASGDATMLLGFRTWVAYLPMVPSFFLLGCAALSTTWVAAAGGAPHGGQP